MDGVIYAELTALFGWRFAKAQRDSLARYEAEKADSFPTSDDAESSRSNSGSTFHPDMPPRPPRPLRPSPSLGRDVARTSIERYGWWETMVVRNKSAANARKGAQKAGS